MKTKKISGILNAAKDFLSKKSKEDQAVFADFVQQFYGPVPEAEIGPLDEGELFEIIRILWDMAQARKKHAFDISVVPLRVSRQGGDRERTAIYIVNDDMPFIIDSVTAEIASRGLSIARLFHPILRVRRSDRHSVSDIIARAGQEIEEGYSDESCVYIELDEPLPEGVHEELQETLSSVLDDVRHATRDWPLVLKKLQAVIHSLEKGNTGSSLEELLELREFLRYLYEGNFTLLGYRHYTFDCEDKSVKSCITKGAGLGLLQDESRPVWWSGRKEKGLPAEIQEYRRNCGLLTVSKVNRDSTVHRKVPMDAIAVKSMDEEGNVTGEHLFIGLFTSVTYSRSVHNVPYIRRKVERVIDKAGYSNHSHNAKALSHILEKYPRDEVFQMSIDELKEIAVSILHLQEQQRVALFERRDPFNRFVSCLVYVPRERYSTKIRKIFQSILEKELSGTCDTFYTTLDDSLLARVLFIVNINQENPPVYNPQELEEKLIEAGRTFEEKLRRALIESSDFGDRAAINTAHKYGNAFSGNYTEMHASSTAIEDIMKVEECLETGGIGLDLYQPDNFNGTSLWLKVFRPSLPMTLSDILPILENMGLKVIAEMPYEILPEGVDAPVWLHDFMMDFGPNVSFDITKVKENFEEAFMKIWDREQENDALNKLIISAGLSARQITILRSYSRYMRQIRFPFSQFFIMKTLNDHPDISRLLIDAFDAQLNPERAKEKSTLVARCFNEINKHLEEVSHIDQDKVLRSMSDLVRASLRTNYYQMTKEGQQKEYLSIKFDCALVPDMPAPRPYREIFVYSPRVEGVHLRGGAIARGGLRWSDRHEDFRTEVLGLMKAQMVKNTVIVPVGAKGGFVMKQPPVEGGRDAWLAEGIECYKTFIRGLLDITDNKKGTKILPPKDVVRRDSDDPYLVVAADKGTATFSDIANGLSQEYGFWMDDAFASGGSAGYDHKKMGITARGAWESVKRHFRELGKNIQEEEFDVIGIGDMGGDVFGNGMLLSKYIRLIGAFNHLHIFCDPMPDVAKSFKERNRLFKAVKGWDGYNEKLLSKGGRIYNRSDKTLELTPEIKAAFGLKKDVVPPNELIHAMLQSKTDLLWFGGIGTYIKSSRESDAHVGDKANDVIRVDAPEVRAAVIGEGANLAITQEGRDQFSYKGGKINADFIDNSGGVDSSDHEVNIKILLRDVMDRKDATMTRDSRNVLLEDMTEQVADAVLLNNYQQSQAISLMASVARENLEKHAQMIRYLERTRGLDRTLEGLPGEEEVSDRQRKGEGLRRTEICVLQSYAKMDFFEELLDSDIADETQLKGWVLRYFPQQIQKKYSEHILDHQLCREIICTDLTNSIINRMGASFVPEMKEKTDSSAADIARAYLVVIDSFDMRKIWKNIESMDNKISANAQLRAMREANRLVQRIVTWILRNGEKPIDITHEIKTYTKGLNAFLSCVMDVVSKDSRAHIERRRKGFLSDGFNPELSDLLAMQPVLAAACDIIRLSGDTKAPIDLSAKVYFSLSDLFSYDWLRRQARTMSVDTHWQVRALDGMVDALYVNQADLAENILSSMPHRKEDRTKEKMVGMWQENHRDSIVGIESIIQDIRHAKAFDLAMLSVALQKLQRL